MTTDKQVEAACIRFYGDDYWNCVVSTAFQEQERNRMRAVLAAAADVGDQEAGKPAFILKFADQDMSDIVFCGDGAEEAARKTFDLRRTAWTVYLFKLIARG